MIRASIAVPVILGAALAIVSCDDESSDATPTGTVTGSTTGTTTGTATGQGGSSTGTATGQGGSGTGTATGQGGSGTGGGAQGGQAGDIPGGGTILFQEHFEDADFGNRGWYDGAAGTISSTEHAVGSGSFECSFAQGAASCTGGKPARHKFTASESVYMSMYLKFSSNWVGSGMAYHPHMFHFLNDLDSDYVGPSHTFLTTYMEVVNERAMLALQDGKNVDLNCILQNNDNFIGCGGDFDTYSFTEDRSVCGCNGPKVDPCSNPTGSRDCFSTGASTYYSSRAWRRDGAFTDSPGNYDKTEWHFVEVYFEMNSINGGVAQTDGKIRWVQDGEVLISCDEVLMRTNTHADLAFDQFAMLPYIGPPGSPSVQPQSFFVDELTVATARP